MAAEKKDVETEPHEAMMSKEELWDHYDTDRDKSKVHSPIFANLSFAYDGGYSEVKDLFVYDPLRYIWAAMLVSFVLLNVWSLTTVNFPVILSWLAGDKTSEFSTKQWLISKTILSMVVPPLANLIDSHVVLACIEVGILCDWCRRAYQEVRHFSEPKERIKWHAISKFCFFQLPELSSMSAMRVLYNVTPSILIPQVSRSIKVLSRRQLARFFFSHLIYLIIGCDAFLIKAMEVAHKGDFQSSHHAMLLLAFMNQMLGIVNVQQFSEWRLFLFVFGGEDTFMDRNEENKKDIWHAMLAREMWRAEKNSLLRYFTLLLSYSDYDFQKLVVNEQQVKKLGGSTKAE